MGVKERSLSSNVMEIRGGRRLTGGKVAVAGSSNQVTKCIIASLLTDEDVIVQGAPEVNERKVVQELFQYLGGRVDELDPGPLALLGCALLLAGCAQRPSDLQAEVPVVVRELDDRAMLDLQDVLQNTPGVSVDYTDSERVTYYSRGYQIDALQIDGVTVNQAGGQRDQDLVPHHDERLHGRPRFDADARARRDARPQTAPGRPAEPRRRRLRAGPRPGRLPAGP